MIDYIKSMESADPPLFDSEEEKNEFIDIVYKEDADENEESEDSDDDEESDESFTNQFSQDERDMAIMFIHDMTMSLISFIIHDCFGLIINSDQSTLAESTIDQVLSDGLFAIFQQAREKMTNCEYDLDFLATTADDSAIITKFNRIKLDRSYKLIAPKYAAEKVYALIRPNFQDMMDCISAYTKDEVKRIAPDLIESAMKQELTEPWISERE
jgi:hypothetical protein